MKKSFKKMTLSIIPLAVILMSYVSEGYKVASADEKTNGKETDSNKQKVVTKSDSELINLAIQIESQLKEYYTGELSYVNSQYKNDLAKALKDNEKSLTIHLENLE